MPKKKKTTALEVVTPEGMAYEGRIETLEAPAVDGLIGIWPRHAPLVTALEIGVLQIQTPEQEVSISISGGFMDVKPEEINIVVRTAELPDEIDVERAEKAKERAEKRLENRGDKRIDQARAEAALERALARLKAAEQSRRI